MATTVAHVALNTLCLSAAAPLGSLPFFFLKTLTERAMAAGNALAAGFMLAAAFAILNESMAPAEYDAASPASFAVALFGPTSAWIQRAHVIDVACGVMLGVWALGAADTLLEYLGFGEDSHAPPALEEPPAAAPLVVAPVKAKQSPRASSRDRALQSRGQRQRVGSASPRRRSAKSNMPSPGTDAETSAVVQSSAAAAAAADMIVARRRAFAFLVSITMHAMAEGLGMGVACAGQSGEAHGQSYTIAMSLHNVPEGAAVTTVLLARGFTPLQAMLANVLHCLPQVLLSVPAFLFVGWASRLQGLAAGVAAGSLLFTALTELLPEASSLGNQRAGTLVIMSAVLMMIIDACLH